jgi:predicted nucleic acid-binding protein
MIVLVNDANILIDLLKLDLIDPFFQLHCEFHVTDLVAAEVLEENVKELERYVTDGILIKRSFAFEELQEIRLVKNKHPGLSIADCSCVYLSTRLSATLLTGDAVLRRAAKRNRIPVHGLFWVFEELLVQSILSKKQAHKKLTKLMEINPRLPKKECQDRLKTWK